MEVGAHDTQRRSRDVLASQEDAQEMKKRIRFTRCYSEISRKWENCWQKLLAKSVGKNCYNLKNYYTAVATGREYFVWRRW